MNSIDYCVNFVSSVQHSPSLLPLPSREGSLCLDKTMPLLSPYRDDDDGDDRTIINEDIDETITDDDAADDKLSEHNVKKFSR